MYIYLIDEYDWVNPFTATFQSRTILPFVSISINNLARMCRLIRLKEFPKLITCQLCVFVAKELLLRCQLGTWIFYVIIEEF